MAVDNPCGMEERLCHDDHLERHHAAAALGRSGDVGAAPALIALVEAEGRGHWLPWITGIQALGALGDTRACPALIASLRSANRTVRAEAVLALADAGDIDAVEPLRALARDTDEEEYLRRSAAETLAILGGGPEPLGSPADITVVWAYERAQAERQARWEARLDAVLADDGILEHAVDEIVLAAEVIADGADALADAVGEILDET